jgi:small-conductance mechanosensitive channel
MKVNMGVADRIIRIIVALIIALLYFMNQITGVAAIVLGILAIILVLTSLVGNCLLYVPFKISTKKKKEASE